MIEVEAKYKCENLGEVEAALLQKGYKYLGSRIEEDTYFQHPCRDFKETDEALRIRRILEPGGASIELTYKGPRVLGKKDVKEREEITVSLNTRDYEALMLLLERLGFRRVAVVKKERRIYRNKEIQVMIDKVDNLGSFIEVEVISEVIGGTLAERIKSIIKDLGIKGQAVDKTYLELLIEKQKS